MDNKEDKQQLRISTTTSSSQQALIGAHSRPQQASPVGMTWATEGPSSRPSTIYSSAFSEPQLASLAIGQDDASLKPTQPVDDHPVSPSRYSYAPDKRSVRIDSGYGFLPEGRPIQRPYSIKNGYTPGNPYSQSLATLTEELPCVNESATGSIAGPPLARPPSTRRKKSGLWRRVTAFWEGYSIQAFNGLLLFLPLLYYSRVTEIFKEVQCSGERLKDAIKENIKQNSEEIKNNQEGEGRTPGSAHAYYDLSRCPPEVENLKTLWNRFIDAVTKEWEIMNIVAVLLLTAIISSMQIEPVFADEIVRYIAFAALVCGLMSLIYSCTYIIRFSIMRPIHKAVEWAKEGEAAKTAPFWNVWIFLSIPAIWLSWSLILFVAEIIAFIWLVDSPDSAKALSPGLRLAARVAISVVLASGVVYLALILSTLKRYGAQMDNAWIASINNESEVPTHTTFEARQFSEPRFPLFDNFPRRRESGFHGEKDSFQDAAANDLGPAVLRQSPEPLSPAEAGNRPTGFYRPVIVTKFVFGGTEYHQEEPPDIVYTRLGGQEKWKEFVQEVNQAWQHTHLVWESLLTVIQRWNRELRPRQMEALLCHETGHPPSYLQHYVVYLTDLAFASDLALRFNHVAEDAERCDIFDDTGALKLRLEAPGKTKQLDPKRRLQFSTAEKKNSKSSSNGDTMDILILPPSNAGSRSSTFDSPGAINDTHATPQQSIRETPHEQQAPPPRDVEDKAPKVLRRPRSAMRSASNRSTELKTHKHAEAPPIPAIPPTPSSKIERISESSETAANPGPFPPPAGGPGLSPLLQRRLPGRFLHSPNFDIQDVYSIDELSCSATLTPTTTLTIWHKRIPHTLCVQKEPLITVGDLFKQIAKMLQQPVPKNYLRGSELDVINRLHSAAGQRVQVGSLGAQTDAQPDVIRTVDWIWDDTSHICGFIEHQNGTWELDFRET